MSSTPGPWIADCWITKGWFVKRLGGGDIICTLTDRECSHGMEHHPKDDAALIAAAPELLAACREVVRWAETPGPHGQNPWTLPMVKKAEAAIAKAEGR